MVLTTTYLVIRFIVETTREGDENSSKLNGRTTRQMRQLREIRIEQVSEWFMCTTHNIGGQPDLYDSFYDLYW